MGPDSNQERCLCSSGKQPAPLAAAIHIRSLPFQQNSDGIHLLMGGYRHDAHGLGTLSVRQPVTSMHRLPAVPVM